jgi:hypothetical protein
MPFWSALIVAGEAVTDVEETTLLEALKVVIV